MAKVSLRAYNREIEAMIDRSHLEEAVAHCQHILKTFPKHLETYRLLGKAYLEAKRYNEAADIFSRVLAAEPGDFVAHVGMSIIRDEQNKLDDAIWHMERAFDVQSANPAIQAELQRLYGRRDGVPPPRIRLTRGALANMYMRGELYPQTISEAKNILEEDAGRSDIQLLLAKAYFQSGQKKDAADAASDILKRLPYCREANLILAEILGVDRPESAQPYRQRVIELDPYAAQADSLLRSAEVSDAAVSLEQLEWNGQEVGMRSDWTSAAIALESGAPDEQPDWLKSSFPQETPLSAPGLDSETPASPSSAAEEDIPDFLRAAGWGAATGAFDESKASMFEEEAPAEPLAQGDLPDWIKAMAPAEALQPAEEPQEEELPDWINKIGTDELPVPSAPAPAEDLDWLKGMEQQEQPPSSAETQPAPAEDLDWLKGLEQEEQAPAAPEETPVSAAEEAPDWLKSFGAEEQPVPAAEEQPDWLKDFVHEAAPAAEEQPDWLKSLDAEPAAGIQPPAEEAPTAPVPSASADTGALGTTEKEQDDAFAWLESLAARQGATEGLLTQPEERLTEEPDWVKQVKKTTGELKPAPQAAQPVEEKPAEPPAPAPQPAEANIDDALAWLESLAAKQGATEGLLTRPEERREEAPEWVKQAQELEPAAQPPELEEPQAAAEPQPAEADVASWLQSLDEAETPIEPAPIEAGETSEWLKSLDEAQAEAPAEPASELPAWLQGVSEETAPEAATTVPEVEAVQESAPEELPAWLSNLEEEQPPVIPAAEDLPPWLRDETGELLVEPTKIEPTRPVDWKPVEEPPQPAPEPAPEPEPEPKPKKAPRKEPKPAPPATYVEPVTSLRGTGMLRTPGDPLLASARTELSRSNIPAALDAYGKLIKKGRYLEEVIYDLREALYRYPVEVSIWQALGDAYMRANQLQDALDAYTKAEELLR
ncbi:MAG: tetratricopeptide repeat protein [Chloroflexota bacterium]|jgi:tetratricopeptide (TPR) repeat protein